MKNKFTRTDLRAALTAAGMETNQVLIAQIIEALADALAAGKVIELRGLGTLEPRERKARIAHNPRTLAPVNVPARRVVFFRPSGKLKNALNREGGSPM
jgi:integration host factor subunit beta